MSSGYSAKHIGLTRHFSKQDVQHIGTAFAPSVFSPLSVTKTQFNDRQVETNAGSKVGQLDLSLAPGMWVGPQSILQIGILETASWRALEVVLTVLAIVVAAPFFALAAVAVAVSSPGPIFYVQERVGAKGRPFRLIKFRSMRVDAEAGGAQWARHRDPRVTPVGRFLRLTRFDELPQLLNVLSGSMSLIGPRPERPMFVEQLRTVIPHFDDRTLIRPGITGWAQVNYRYCASVEDAREKLAYDLYYLKHRSMRLNLKIILLTISVVWTQAGSR